MHFLSILSSILAIILLVSVVAGLHARTEKYVTYGLELSRLMAFILLALTIYLTLAHVQPHLWLGIVSVAWQFLTLLLLESAFRRKRETFGSPRLSALSTLAGLVIIILTLI